MKNTKSTLENKIARLKSREGFIKNSYMNERQKKVALEQIKEELETLRAEYASYLITNPTHKVVLENEQIEVVNVPASFGHM